MTKGQHAYGSARKRSRTGDERTDSTSHHRADSPAHEEQTIARGKARNWQTRRRQPRREDPSSTVRGRAEAAKGGIGRAVAAPHIHSHTSHHGPVARSTPTHISMGGFV